MTEILQRPPPTDAPNTYLHRIYLDRTRNTTGECVAYNDDGERPELCLRTAGATDTSSLWWQWADECREVECCHAPDCAVAVSSRHECSCGGKCCEP